MSWQALYDVATGRLISVGDVVADALPDGLAALPLAGSPADSDMWDAATRSFVARPAKVLVDRLQDLLSDADFAAAWASLSAAQRTRLRTALIRLLGRQRYRAASKAQEL